MPTLFSLARDQTQSKQLQSICNLVERASNLEELYIAIDQLNFLSLGDNLFNKAKVKPILAQASTIAIPA